MLQKSHFLRRGFAPRALERPGQRRDVLRLRRETLPVQLGPISGTAPGRSGGGQLESRPTGPTLWVMTLGFPSGLEVSAAAVAQPCPASRAARGSQLRGTSV